MAAKCFFQKHLETLPPPVHSVPIEDESGPAKYVTIDDLPGLITLVQFGALELHPWGSRVDKLEQPDRLIFDLDPAPEMAWKSVAIAAVRMRELLQEFELDSYLRTTGGKGLHVVVPLVRKADWDTAKSFCRSVSEVLVRRWPGEYLATASKARRRGKIFIDYLRNGRGATSVASYSTRARPGATVATPIAWDELTPRLRPESFDVSSVPKRLAALSADPWADFQHVRQSIGKAALATAQRLLR